MYLLKIKSVKEIKSDNLQKFIYNKNEKLAQEFAGEYISTLNKLIDKQRTYQKVTIIDIDIFVNELESITKNKYYYEDKTFVEFILYIIYGYNEIIENLDQKDKSKGKKIKRDKITFTTFTKILNVITFKKDHKFFLRNILDNPFDLIDIENRCITFNQCIHILKLKNIDVKDNPSIVLKNLKKWCISCLQDNGGSFFKTKIKYINYNDKSYTQTWGYLLDDLCKNNKLTKYKDSFENKLFNKLLIPHKNNSNMCTIQEFINFETNISDKFMDIFHPMSEINEEEVVEEEVVDEEVNIREFIHSFEENKTKLITTPNKRFGFTEKQKQAIIDSIINKENNITGPPGTGKSTIVECIIEYYNNKYNNTQSDTYNISLLAPTGKAIKGLLDKCSNIKNKNICGTIHKCVLNTFPKIAKHNSTDINSNDNNTNNNIAQRPTMDDNLPRNIDMIIVDEASMIDIYLFNNLLKWCKYFNSDGTNCKLILVGDIEQLPPVGLGRPFECIMKSGLFNKNELDEIKRQDNGTLKNCILDLKNNKLSIDNFDGNTTRFIEHDFQNKDETSNIFTQIVEEFGKENIAVISPENNNERGDGAGGVYEMNKLLQIICNPDEEIRHSIFKHGDYVIRKENDYTQDIIRVNGDSGIIHFNKNNTTNRKYNKKNEAIVYYDDDNAHVKNSETINYDNLYDTFALNYCCTVHKFQGSQKKVIVFICSSNHSSLLTGSNRKKLAHTAISRPTHNLICIGNKDVLFKHIQNCEEPPFITCFMENFNKYDTD